MRRLPTAILAIGIALVFMIYMVTYTVGYNEIAIITTFENAVEPDPDKLAAGEDTGSVMQEPGLKFKWPWPIQRVQTFPTQLQVLSDTPEQLQLSDGNTIIINLALTWRIQDPLAFSIAHDDFDDARDKLLAQMRDLRSIVSNNYTFAQLVNEDPTQIELAKLEQEVADELADRLLNMQLDWGIEVSRVTVGKMLYTESTAAGVNERMTATQQRKAQYILSEGESQAQAIVAEAESISKRLNDFAETVASEIETRGREEANAILLRYAEKGASEDLAIYLRQLEAIEKILANRTTFVLNAKTFTPLDVLVYGHGEPGNLSRLFGETETSSLQDELTPLNTEEANRVIRERIALLQQRIAQLEAQLDAMRSTETAPPLRPSAQEPVSTEARP
ncbi:MAG: SPFH domain-containing protein [Phycisphaeraceae bacterium]